MENTEKENPLSQNKKKPKIGNWKFFILGILVAVYLAIRAFFYYNDIPQAISQNSYVLSILIGMAAIPLVYALSSKITNSAEAGLFSAALMPALQFYSWRVGGFANHTIAFVFFLLVLLCFLYLREALDWRIAIVVPLIFSFVHVYSLVLIPIFGIYVLLLKLEKAKLNRSEAMFMLVSGICVLGVFFLFTAKPAFLMLVEQYIRTGYYTYLAENFSIMQILKLAGLLPIYLGFLGLCIGIAKRMKAVIFLLSALIVVFLSMLFNVVPLKLALPYFAALLAVFSGFAYKELESKLETSKFKEYTAYIFAAVLIIVIFFGFVHALL